MSPSMRLCTINFQQSLSSFEEAVENLMHAIRMIYPINHNRRILVGTLLFPVQFVLSLLAGVAALARTSINLLAKLDFSTR